MDDTPRHSSRGLIVGMCASAFVFSGALVVSSWKLSSSIERAGANASSHYSGSSFPSALSVRLVTLHTKYSAQDRKHLSDAFCKASTGVKVKDSKVKSVRITKMWSSVDVDMVGIQCVVALENGSMLNECRGRLIPDGFGGYEIQIDRFEEGRFNMLVQGIRIE